MTASSGTLPQFPDRALYARAIFEEAARHLLDARFLHEAGRFPGSITSSMKAVELSLKAILVLDGAMGWIDRLFQTHIVYSEFLKRYSVLQSHSRALSAHDPDLVLEIELLEKLVPGKPDVKNLTLSEVANTEYPFFAEDAATGVPRLYTPSTHFTLSESRKHFETARKLLLALQAIYPDIQAWAVPTCAPL